MVPSISQRKAILKRFIFVDQGKVFSYSSSVPDSVHPEEEDEVGREERFDILHQSVCFARRSNDIVLTKTFQLHLREAHS